MTHKDLTKGAVKQFPVEESPLLGLVRRLDRDQGSMSKVLAMKALKRLGDSTLRYEIRVFQVSSFAD